MPNNAKPEPKLWPKLNIERPHSTLETVETQLSDFGPSIQSCKAFSGSKKNGLQG